MTNDVDLKWERSRVAGLGGSKEINIVKVRSL
jgi:hypothetical protein